MPATHKARCQALARRGSLQVWLSSSLGFFLLLLFRDGATITFGGKFHVTPFPPWGDNGAHRSVQIRFAVQLRAQRDVGSYSRDARIRRSLCRRRKARQSCAELP